AIKVLAGPREIHGEAGQDADGGGSGIAQSWERATRGRYLVDGVDTIAAAAFGDVESAVEGVDRQAAEVVVLARLVGRETKIRDRETALVAGGASEDALHLADNGGIAAGAGGDHLHAGVVAEHAQDGAGLGDGGGEAGGAAGKGGGADLEVG